MSRFPFFAFLLGFSLAVPAAAQLVVLPSPRLLTTLPMGGKAGSSVEVTITGENIEEVTALQFSTPKIAAKPVTGPDGQPVEHKFLVTIAPDAPVGVPVARVPSWPCISSPLAISATSDDEITHAVAHHSV